VTALVRAERPGDELAVRRVNEAAFERVAEGALVDALRAAGQAVVSLVAEADGAVVGHVLLSPVAVDGARSGHVVGLAPMAVVPAWQRRGVGTALVRGALAAARARGHGAVVVLGHPGYYPRFGFVPASRFGLRCEYDAPDDAFLACELRPGALDACRGLVRYRPEFAAV
jgi:putative acetyltransferase